MAVKITTEDELDKQIQLKVGVQIAQIARGIFKKMFEDEKEKMDGKVSKLIYGGIIATVLVLIALIATTWLFMSSYQQDYLDTQSAFNEQINTLRKENMDLQLELKNSLNRTEEKQQYLERILLERSNS